MTQANPHDDEALLRELLARWEESLAATGIHPSPEEICRDHPHLLERFRAAISKLNRANAMLSVGVVTVTQQTPSQPASIPQTIGPYRILGLLGEGGMGTVYKAEQRAPLKRTVAIKVIKAGFDTAEVIARFQAEHQALARLDHPNIARIYDAGTTDTGRAYFVMEYLPGEPVTLFCDTNKLSIRQRLELFQQACDAITHAHIKAIVHRDIKASNVLAFMHDGKPMVKVIDFGIAKALTGDRLTDLTFNTGRGVVVGTYDSMSPEQADGSADIDTRTDVYSMGVLLYELITGAKPFDMRTLAKAADVEIRRIIRDVDPPRPSTRFSSLGDSATRVAAVRQSKVDQLTRELRGDLEWIPLKAMRKERNGRYASPLQMSEDIDNYLAGRPLIAGPVSGVYRLRKFVVRNGRPLAMSACLILITVGATVFYIWRIRQKEAQISREQAQTRLALGHESEQRRIAQANLISADLKQAELAAQRGKWAEALSAYDAADLAGAADVRLVLLGRVVSLQCIGNTAAARRAMDDALRDHKELADDPVVMARRGELMWDSNPEEGEQLLRTAMQRGLPAGEQAFARGLLADSIPDAIDQFRLAVAADPFRQDAIGILAILSTAMARPDAQENAVAWMRMFPDDPGARILCCIQLALHGDEPGARRLLDESVRVIDPKLKPDLERTIDLLTSLESHRMEGGAAEPADLIRYCQVAFSKDKSSFNRSNLLFPKILGGCIRAILDGVTQQAAGQMLGKVGLTGPAKSAFNQAADSYLAAEKSLPIGILFVMRADVLRSADRLEECADEYERALAASAPIDIAAYAEAGALEGCVQADRAAGKTPIEVARDPRVILHARRAAELGVCGTTSFLWNTAAYIAVAGRHADDARAILELWKKVMPKDPNHCVLEMENQYVQGNYGNALRLLADSERAFPQYDFGGVQSIRDKCIRAIREENFNPPSTDEPLIDLNYTVPLRPTTKPAPAR